MCAAVLGAAAVLVVLFLGLLHARRQLGSGHSLWGKLLPPGVGPGTTLLVTDIQVLCACPRSIAASQDMQAAYMSRWLDADIMVPFPSYPLVASRFDTADTLGHCAVSRVISMPCAHGLIARAEPILSLLSCFVLGTKT